MMLCHHQYSYGVIIISNIISTHIYKAILVYLHTLNPQHSPASSVCRGNMSEGPMPLRFTAEMERLQAVYGVRCVRVSCELGVYVLLDPRGPCRTAAYSIISPFGSTGAYHDTRIEVEERFLLIPSKGAELGTITHTQGKTMFLTVVLTANHRFILMLLFKSVIVSIAISQELV